MGGTAEIYQRKGTAGTHGIQSCAVNSQLNNLDSSIVACTDGGIHGKRDLGQTDGARVGVLGGADNAKLRDHGVGHVGWAAVRPVGAKAEIYENLGRGMALEPARLERNSSAGHRPVCAIRRRVHATACVRPTRKSMSETANSNPPRAVYSLFVAARVRGESQ